jgi:peptidylprolyl isomerase
MRPDLASNPSPLEPLMIRSLFCAVLALFALASVARAPAFAQAADPQNTLVIELKTGKVLIKLRPDLAPKHVERAKTLAKQGFYDGIKFHRVIDGFMAQTGDPTGTGSGGSKLPDLPAEFTREVYRRGSVGAARTSDPNSANSQFFICFGDGCRGLTGQYSLWGEVIEGMEHVDKITRGEPPRQPDVMQKVYLLSDAKK